MLSNLPLFIGLRYTRSKRSEGFVSFISGFSLCAMALGVAALIVVLSVMNGFDREIKSRLLKIVPHITITDPRGLDQQQIDSLQSRLNSETDPMVLSVVPMLQGYVMLSQAEQQAGVVLQGLDPGLSTAEKLADNMLSGHVQQLEEGEFGIILGSQLARKLDVFVGDQLQLTLPKVSVTPAGIFPRIKRVRVVGIFRVGAQVDASVAFIHFRDGQKLLQMGDRFHSVQVELADPFAAESWLLEKQAAISAGDYEWRSWMDDMGSLFQAMRMEKVIVSLLLSVIIAVAAFNIVASLVLMVSDKRSDIAVMRTMGASSATVVKVFMIQGMAVGALGILIGTFFGCLLAYFIGDIVAALESLAGFYIFDPSIYLISALPSRILPGDLLIVISGAFVISFLATLYPAWRAGKVLPAEALRYDH